MDNEERQFSELLEASGDVHADAMRTTTADLNELVEIGMEQRARGDIQPEESAAFAHARNAHANMLIGAGAVAGIGAAVLGLGQSVASASTPTDVQILQTQASIENLAVATYTVALTLPFIGGSSAIPVVKAFVKQTMAQHKDHAAAFNSAISKLGGKKQTAPDPVLLKVVNKAKPGLTGPAQVVALALELEDGAAQTYVANTSALSNLNARKVTASIMGVEAQHVAILLAVQALIKGGATKLITLPPSPLSALPAAAGSVGFPHNFYPTTAARPRTEGARS